MWQSGMNSKFVGVDWHGDESQLDFPLPYFGTVSPDYYVNVENAFRAAGKLKDALDCLPGEKVVMGHSLGNVVVSSAICDKGLECKYYLLNAAVAGEAYDASMINREMAWSRWRALPKNTWAANWHELALFKKNGRDFRRELFWRNRFCKLKNAVSYYSGTEDVLTNPTEDGLGASWSKQELFKGSIVKSLISAGHDAGWSFSDRYLKRVYESENPWDAAENSSSGLSSGVSYVMDIERIKALDEK